MQVRIVCTDGEIIDGTSESDSLTQVGYPVVPDGSRVQEPAWIALAAIRYVIVPGPPAPGLVDPREGAGYSKILVRFLDGEVVRTYRDDYFAPEGQGLRLLRWSRDTQHFERLLIPAHTLKSFFTVKSWDAGAPAAERVPAGVAATRQGAAGGLDPIQSSLVAAVASRLRSELVEVADSDLASRDQATFRAAVDRHLDHLLETAEVVATPVLRAAVLDRLVGDAFGYGPLDELLADPTVTEIMVNSPAEIFVERDGVISRAAVSFVDEAHLLNTIQKIVTEAGRRLDQSSPMVDARLPDGSRVNAVLPPASPRGATLTIRKFLEVEWRLDRLVSRGTLSAEMADFLDRAVQARCNILVSGGTGSGKTTLLNVLAMQIPPEQRVITIEDTLELHIDHQDLVALECRGANVEGSGQLTTRDLLRNSLRMRPDRIVVGEVRGVEAFDMIQALITGHEGGLSTIHANSPREAMLRLESLALAGSPGMTLEAIRSQIAAAIDVVVQVARFDDGTRRVVEIVELGGFGASGPDLEQDFAFEAGAGGELRFVSLGIGRRVLDKLGWHGVEPPAGLPRRGEPPRPRVVARRAAARELPLPVKAAG